MQMYSPYSLFGISENMPDFMWDHHLLIAAVIAGVVVFFIYTM